MSIHRNEFKKSTTLEEVINFLKQEGGIGIIRIMFQDDLVVVEWED